MKNSGNELAELLENKGRGLKNELKTNSKRTQIECPVRAFNAEFRLFDAPHVAAEELERGNRIVRLWEVPRSGRKYKNSRNEAKKYLKTKDITFLSGANDARFAHKSAQIGR